MARERSSDSWGRANDVSDAGKVEKSKESPLARRRGLSRVEFEEVGDRGNEGTMDKGASQGSVFDAESDD